MEECQTFKPFLEDVINMALPSRIHIELQEVPVLPFNNMNLRRKAYENCVYPWRIISLDPHKQNNLVKPFLEMLSNEKLFKKKIRRVGILCKEGAIELAKNPIKEDAVRHYIFGQFIDVAPMYLHLKELSYVSIWDLEFETKSLKNTKGFIDGRSIRKSAELIKKDRKSIDLPF